METEYAQVCDDILALMSHLKSRMVIAAEKYELTPMQLAALYAVMNGSETMGHLATDMHCDASNATGIVDRLVAQGHLQRKESKTDRRTKTLRLTEKGLKLMQDILSEMPKLLGCDRLTAREVEQVHIVRQKLLN